MSQDLDLHVIQTRAKVLAAADRSMRRSLIALRRDAGLTQQNVADFMGCTQQAVQKLERYDAGPQLSTLRRYANAVGALVSHAVVRDETSMLWAIDRERVVASEPSRITVPVFTPSVKFTLPTYGPASKVSVFGLAA